MAALSLKKATLMDAGSRRRARRCSIREQAENQEQADPVGEPERAEDPEQQEERPHEDVAHKGDSRTLPVRPHRTTSEVQPVAAVKLVVLGCVNDVESNEPQQHHGGREGLRARAP